MSGHSVASISIATLVSRMLGFAKNVFLAMALGTAVLADTYNVANHVPNMIFTVVAGGILGSVFVPQLVKAANRSRRDWELYAGRLLGIVLLLTAAASVLVTLAAPGIVSILAPASWTTTDIRLCVFFAYMCLPQVFFYAAYATLGQILNSRSEFAAMAWAPAVNNLVVILIGVFLLLTGSIDAKDTGSLESELALTLGLGTTAGVALQSLVLFPLVRRMGVKIRVRRGAMGEVGLGPALRLAKWTLLQLCVTQLSLLVIIKLSAAAGADLLPATGIASGFSAYNYAYLILLLPHAVVAAPVATVLLARVSDLIVRSAWADASDWLRKARRNLAFTIAPIAAFMVIGSPSVTIALFGYGNTSILDAWYIGILTSAFAIGLWAMSSRSLMLYACYSIENTRVPFVVVLFGATANVLGAWIAISILPPFWKLIGVVAAFGLGNYLVDVLLRLSLTKSGLYRRKVEWANFGRIILPVVLAVTVAQTVTLALGGSWYLEAPDLNRSNWQVIPELIGVVVGAAAYFAIAEIIGASVFAAFRFGKRPRN